MKIKGQWIYLYHTVNPKGNTFDFHLSKTRISKATKHFPRKACSIRYNSLRNLYALLSFTLFLH
ncbi:DDE-type integrase/transposase/recombinase [Bacillus tropicus]|nr:DDE-type integrase/transposase/recombinase [Bacillus tropicus]UOK48915.1 DDE-type integrase/transposase/recombinase [Bacillus tropicus]